MKTFYTINEFRTYLFESAPADPLEALDHWRERSENLYAFAVHCAMQAMPEYCAEAERIRAKEEELLKVVGIA